MAGLQVVVCGGGVIGASVSYFLSLRGAKPVVLEAVGPACSASGKAGEWRGTRWRGLTSL